MQHSKQRGLFPRRTRCASTQRTIKMLQRSVFYSLIRGRFCLQCGLCALPLGCVGSATLTNTHAAVFTGTVWALPLGCGGGSTHTKTQGVGHALLHFAHDFTDFVDVRVVTKDWRRVPVLFDNEIQFEGFTATRSPGRNILVVSQNDRDDALGDKIPEIGIKKTQRKQAPERQSLLLPEGGVDIPPLIVV